MVADNVLSCTGILISRRSMGRLLRRLGYRYIKGESRHFLADSVHNVAYRATYLQHKVQNRDRNNNPIRPEVYLDESYVNTNHKSRLKIGLPTARAAKVTIMVTLMLLNLSYGLQICANNYSTRAMK
ncbi:hypothetical protein PHMEG_00031070 [Phytophthora megakarya]|uniref:Winged helix-turn helix domain-containing protein n=1 Tax=Phytophthora megakarya TaxID=4795 RepID=A0A225UYX6_9STRA|nr:hypothetical protein PHMEG_00031070 [Phytophthora megakarya]